MSSSSTDWLRAATWPDTQIEMNVGPWKRATPHGICTHIVIALGLPRGAAALIEYRIGFAMQEYHQAPVPFHLTPPPPPHLAHHQSASWAELSVCSGRDELGQTKSNVTATKNMITISYCQQEERGQEYNPIVIYRHHRSRGFSKQPIHYHSGTSSLCYQHYAGNSSSSSSWTVGKEERIITATHTTDTFINLSLNWPLKRLLPSTHSLRWLHQLITGEHLHNIVAVCGAQEADYLTHLRLRLHLLTPPRKPIHNYGTIYLHRSESQEMLWRLNLLASEGGSRNKVCYVVLVLRVSFVFST